MNILKYFKNSREMKNASWLIAGKVFQMIISFFVSVISARYLGPSNYGLINYGLAYVTFFAAIANLGINSILVNEFVKRPDSIGQTIGTTIVLRIISCIICSCIIFIIVYFLDYGEITTIIVVVLCSISLLFQTFEVFNYWFQSRYESKFVSVATLIAYIFTAVYKIVLLIFGKDIYWFAIANSIDGLIYGILIFSMYKSKKGPKLVFSYSRAKEMLKVSYNYIFASAMIAIYMQTDKFMIKQIVGETEVGYYSIASSLCSIWAFVLTAIIDSLFPTIIKLYEKDDEYEFNKKNKQLYFLVFYISIFVSFLFLFLGDLAVNILYGEAYANSAGIVKILTWYTAFAYLGVARNAWIICKNAQKYLKYLYVGAALLNVLLNFILIPRGGAIGAALASLITQVCTSIVFPLFFKKTRENSKLMLESILCIGIIDKKRENIQK